MLKLGKLDAPDSVHQINGEYLCGNYQNVISLCEMKMADPNISKDTKYAYLLYLANVYFDIGDDENLRKICECFNAKLSSEEPKVQKNIRATLSRMELYNSYANNDMDGCIRMMNEPFPHPSLQYFRNFFRARLALIQGNMEQARKYYQDLSENAQRSNYKKLAAKLLTKLENSEASDYTLTLAEVEGDQPAELELCYAAPKRNWLKLTIDFIVSAIIILSIAIPLTNIRLDREHREDIRVLVEEDHDDVVILDTFTLKNGKEIVEDMFICQTDSEIILGCVYVYEDETQLYYDNIYDFSLSHICKGKQFFAYCSFPAEISDNQVNCSFWTVKEKVPTEYIHLSEFEVNGKTVYFVVTDITPYTSAE